MSNFNDAARQMAKDALTRSVAGEQLRTQECPLCGARNRPDKLIIILQAGGEAWCWNCSDSFPVPE